MLGRLLCLVRAFAPALAGTLAKSIVLHYKYTAASTAAYFVLAAIFLWKRPVVSSNVLILYFNNFKIFWIIILLFLNYNSWNTQISFWTISFVIWNNQHKRSLICFLMLYFGRCFLERLKIQKRNKNNQQSLKECLKGKEVYWFLFKVSNTYCKIKYITFPYISVISIL